MSTQCSNCGRDDLPEQSEFCYHCGFNVIPLNTIEENDPSTFVSDTQDATVEAVAMSELLPWLPGSSHHSINEDVAASSDILDSVHTQAVDQQNTSFPPPSNKDVADISQAFVTTQCSNCGTGDLPQDSQFCYNCGFNVIPLSNIEPIESSDTQDATIEAVAIADLLPWLANSPYRSKKNDSATLPQTPESAYEETVGQQDVSSSSKSDQDTPSDPQVDTTQCLNCGFANLPTDSQFCYNCGFNILPLSNVEAIDPTDTQDATIESMAMSELLPWLHGSLHRPTGDDSGQTLDMPDTESESKITESDGKSAARPLISTGSNGDRQSILTTTSARNIGEVLQRRYRLDKLLGKGGYGAAYLGQDTKLKRICVVKQVLNKKGLSLSQLEERRANFEKEASLLVQLNHPGHPNIPEIYDYFYDESGNYLVMKYIDGKNLKQVIENGGGKIPWRESVRYAIDVCNALHYIHTQGDEPVMHRDIKPANILLGNDDRIWLIDFGLAKEEPLEKTGSQIDKRAAGSIGYAPLEQWFGEAQPSSDVYAVGAMLHHMVTGSNPRRIYGAKFDIQKIHEMHGNFTPIRQIDQKLPHSLEDVITKATTADPTERPNAQQLQQQLEVVLSGAQGAVLYTFTNGQSARTIEELVDLCEKNRAEAQEYLYNGDFEHWFSLINRDDLARAASQAVKQGKNTRDGLESFLKLILPNLITRRLVRFGWQAARATIVIALILFIIVSSIAIGSSYIIGQIIEQTISEGVAWPFSITDLDEKQIYDEVFLNEQANKIAGAYFDDKIRLNVSAPDQVEATTVWNGFSLNFTLSIRLAHKQPRVYITAFHGIPLYPVTFNISQGLNDGIEKAFLRGPIDISSLVVRDGYMTFTLEKANPIEGAVPRPTLAPPTPTFTPLPPTPTPTFTPTPVKNTLVVIFNDIGEAVDIHIEGRTVEGEFWTIIMPISSNTAEVIEPPAGRYNYTVTYQSDGVWAAGGSEDWVLKEAYRVRIGHDPLATPEGTVTP